VWKSGIPFGPPGWDTEGECVMFGGTGGINVVDLRASTATPHFVKHTRNCYIQQVEHTGKDLLMCGGGEFWVGEIS
jgi:hypothetical protein